MYHVARDDLVIECKVSGNPRPTIIWHKNDEPIQFDEGIQQIELIDGFCKLIINKPTPLDNAEYSCTATNKHGEQTITELVEVKPPPNSGAHKRREEYRQSVSKTTDDASAKAESGTRGARGRGKKAKEPPPPAAAAASIYTRRHGPSAEDLLRAARNTLSFITHLKNRVFSVGARIKLTCVVQGPDPSVKWFKNDIPLVYGPRVRNMSSNGTCVLDIIKSELGDSGEYNCVVRNTECEISCICTLLVYDPKTTIDLKPTFSRLKGQLINCAIEEWVK